MKWGKAKLLPLTGFEAPPVPIVADAMISVRGRFGGRLVPLVILDTSERRDIDELVRVHGISPATQGDVKYKWAELKGEEGFISLFLMFVRPVEVKMTLEFSIDKLGAVVEQILLSGALYIQSGREGDRFKNDINRPKIIAEVGDVKFKKHWDKLLPKCIFKRYRKEGMSRTDAKQSTKAFLEEWGKLANSRLSGE